MTTRNHEVTTTTCPSWCFYPHDGANDAHESAGLDVLAHLPEPLPALMWLTSDEHGARVGVEVETMPTELTPVQVRQTVAALTVALGILEAAESASDPSIELSDPTATMGTTNLTEETMTTTSIESAIPLAILRQAWEDRREIQFLGGGNSVDRIRIKYGEYIDGSPQTVDVEQYAGPSIAPDGDPVNRWRNGLPAVYIGAQGQLYPDEARNLAAAILAAADLVDELLGDC